MRRGRFGGIAEDNAVRVNALSPLHVMFFDILSSDDSELEGMKVERVRTLAFAGPYLAAAHLICAVVIMTLDMQRQVELDTILPLVGVVLVAISPYFIGAKSATNARPHWVARFWATFILLLGGLWYWVIATQLAASPGGLSPIAYGALAGAFAFTVAAFISIPSLLLAAYTTAVIAFVMLSIDSGLFPLLLIFGGCLLGASLMSSRESLFAAGRKVAWETEAGKAARLLSGFEKSGHGWFWETDATGVLTYVSPSLAEQLRTSQEDLIGQQFQHVAAAEDEAADAQERSLSFHLSTKLPFSEINVRARSAEDIWWAVSGTPHFDEYGRFLGFSGMSTDLSDKRRAEAEVKQLARYDTLTGLPNRALMRATLDDALRNIDKQHKGCALFLIDLDRFKNVNDTLGHPIGDALLVQVAARLRSVVGEYGQVGRLGGDEFQAVFPNTEEEGWLSLIAEQLIQQVSAPYLIEGNDIRIGASVGIAIARASAQPADELIRDADLALYAAKNDGRGTFKIFAKQMHSQANERRLLEDDLRHAVQRGQLHLKYQPIVHAVTEQVVGFEALLRWDHPEKGSIPPDRFIPLAEETGLIVPIGEWVLRQACEEATNWPASVRMAVNVSPIQFSAPGFATTLVRTLADTGLAPERLEIEITEGVFLSGGEARQTVFNAIKTSGVRLALDDFGTGYSSLGYLQDAPFNKLKIDQSFVRGAANGNHKNASILRAIIALAESLAMDTTAEGVETHDDLMLVRELGCSQVQGYIFGKPMDTEAARALANSVEAVATQGFLTQREPRHRLLRRGSMQWNGMSFPIRLKNISTGGALIESERSIPPGSQVQLDLPDIGHFGAEVRWTNENHLGIKFDEPFKRSKLVPMQGEPAPKPTVLKPDYLATENSPSSPWAARNDRLTIDQLKKGRS